MGYSHDVEIPSDGADLGYRMTSGYSSEYVITSAVPEGLGVTEQFTNNMPGSDTLSQATAVLTYPSHYAANTPMMTTVPYCAPLVTDPYIVQHAGVGYTHPVISIAACTLYSFGIIWVTGRALHYLPYHTGKTFYRVALRPLTGPMRIPKLTVRLQNPQVQYSPRSIPIPGTIPLPRGGLLT